MSESQPIDPKDPAFRAKNSKFWRMNQVAGQLTSVSVLFLLPRYLLAEYSSSQAFDLQAKVKLILQIAFGIALVVLTQT